MLSESGLIIKVCISFGLEITWRIVQTQRQYDSHYADSYACTSFTESRNIVHSKYGDSSLVAVEGSGLGERQVHQATCECMVHGSPQGALAHVTNFSPSQTRVLYSNIQGRISP